MNLPDIHQRVGFAYSSLAFYQSRKDSFKSLLIEERIYEPVDAELKQKFNRLINLIFEKWEREATKCETGNEAKKLFIMAQNSIDFNDVHTVRNVEISITEELFASEFSYREVSFHRVVMCSATLFDIFVFKHPLDPYNSLVIDGINNAVNFSNLVKNTAHSKICGIVYYEACEVHRSNGKKPLKGSLSRVYKFTLGDGFQLSLEILIRMLKRIISTVHIVHSLGWAIVDIKPQHLFVDDNVVDIGDFAACRPFGERLIDTYPEFLPSEFFDKPICKEMDYFCIASTFLAILRRLPSFITCDGILVGVKNLHCSELKNMLLSLIEI